jgi:hypothetical protein
MVPTTSLGLRRHLLIAKHVELLVFQSFKTQKCVSLGAQITRSSVPSYQLILKNIPIRGERAKQVLWGSEAIQ